MFRASRHAGLALALLPALAICACGEEPAPVCPGWEELDVGEIRASVATGGVSDPSGGEWVATGATYRREGSWLRVNVDRQDGYMLVLYAVEDVVGAPVLDRLEAGEFPIEVALGDRDVEGGEALLTTASGETFYTGEGGGGTLTLAGPGAEEGTFAGCFELEAGLAGGGATLSMSAGRFHLGEEGG